MDPAGKVALITGGARIGAVVMEALARRGAAVAIAYNKSRAAAEAAVARAEAAGGRAVAIQGDVRDPESVRALVQFTVDRFGRLDILVNMASVYLARPAEGLTERDWADAVDVDARGAYLATLAAAPHLIAAEEGGRVINFSDWVVASGRPRYKNYVPYYTAKGAALALTQAFAMELAPKVLVNAIAPGPILPPPGMTAEEIEAVKKATPLERWGGAEEIAKTVIFLIESNFITGECVRVDGGRHLV